MEFEITYEFNTSAQTIYNAWLNSQEHAAMTGGEAFVSNKTGEVFTAWDEYISGKNLELIPYSKITQHWRTVEFEEQQNDSILEISLTEINPNKTKLVLKHSNLLPIDIKYKQGWIANYFEPMEIYFNSLK